jgi:hypothetical protein
MADSGGGGGITPAAGGGGGGITPAIGGGGGIPLSITHYSTQEVEEE